MSAALDLDRLQRGHNHPPELLPSLAEQLDPEILAEQKRADYKHHADRCHELTAGFVRMVLQYSTVARYPHDALPAEAERFDLAVAEHPDRLAALSFDGRAWVPLIGESFVRQMLPTVIIPDATAASKVTTFVRQLKDTAKVVDKDRDREKKLFDSAAKVIQLVFKAEILDAYDSLITGIERGPLSVYTNRLIAEERARHAAEAARLQAEADAALAAAQRTRHADMVETAVQIGAEAERAQARAAGPVKDMGRSRGSLGGVSSVVTTWKYRIVDRAKIPAKYWILDEKALGADVKVNKGTAPIAGIEIYEEHGAKVL